MLYTQTLEKLHALRLNRMADALEEQRRALEVIESTTRLFGRRGESVTRSDRRRRELGFESRRRRSLAVRICGETR